MSSEANIPRVMIFTPIFMSVFHDAVPSLQSEGLYFECQLTLFTARVFRAVA